MVMTKPADITFLLPNLPASSEEPRLEAYFSKLISFCRPLSRARNFKYIDYYLIDTIPSYIALKSWMVSYMADIVKQPEDAKTLIQKITSVVFGELGASDPMMFNKTDRSILLDVLSLNMQWAKLFLETPEENISYRDLAYVDAYPALQKIDLIFTTIFLIATQNIMIDDRSVVHKLCLAAKRYLKEVDAALFRNNPILINRLRKPSKNISNAEMERILELSS
ncbi:MAG: hypothetical protein ACOC7P_02460 [Chloroflexota bacterium]